MIAVIVSKASISQGHNLPDGIIATLGLRDTDPSNLTPAGLQQGVPLGPLAVGFGTDTWIQTFVQRFRSTCRLRVVLTVVIRDTGVREVKAGHVAIHSE